MQTNDGRHTFTDTACYNRIGLLNYSLVSLDYIVVKYCNGVAGHSLKFTISAGEEVKIRGANFIALTT